MTPDFETCRIHDFTFVDGRPIQFDLWAPANAPNVDPHAAIVYFHGGKLIGGNRRALVPPFLREFATSRGWAFISADYRLLVPASGQAVLDDVMGLFKYISTHVQQIDCTRIVAFGHSAGAYPALLAAAHTHPKPKALALMYGRGGDFFSSSYLAAPVGCSPEMAAQVTHMLHPTPEERLHLKDEWDVVEENPEHVATPLSTSNPLRASRVLWSAMMAEGTVLDHITGVEGLSGRLRVSATQKGRLLDRERTASPGTSPTTEAGGEGAIVDLELIPPEAKTLIPQLCIGPDFPATYLAHGLLDTAVFPEESVRTYDQLKALGVPVEISLVEDAGHYFEYGVEHKPHIKSALDDISRFLVGHLDA